MSSSVTCGYTDALWEVNAANQDACEQYASLVGLCDSSFTVHSARPSSTPYTPPLNSCGCNLLAYNLQAACGWCQNDIQVTWWLTLEQWQGNCTAGGQSYTNGLPTDITGFASLTIPSWATLTPRSTSWSPSQASAFAVAAASASISGSGATVAAGNGGFGWLNSDSYSGRTATSTRGRTTNFGSSNDSLNEYRNVVGKIGIYIAVLVGIYVLAGLVLLVVYVVRQKRRKAIYGEIARYQRSLRMGNYYPPANNYGYPPPGNALGGVYQPPHAPLLHNNEPNVPGSPSAGGHVSLPSSTPGPVHSSSPYGYHNTGFPPQPPNANPFITPNASTAGLEYSQGGLGYQTQAHPAYAPPSGPPNQGALGFKGHAEVY
ncbi:hypothetical protein FRC19_011573 [Serendipita sp. 401]|nr:hypothetical protein FRC19_011573 [Serendipita sp. 401]KAG8837999.1 hypothetical protein FRC18_006832 [Serendipita sp. 400]KAG9058222.1 hypothetical protein FS842_000163 [Serendipita sp. 407]